MKGGGALVGGLALAVGLIALVGTFAGGALPGEATTMPAAALAKEKGARLHVRLEGAAIARERAIYRSAWGGIYTRDPRTTASVASVDELLRRRDELVGGFVALAAAPTAAGCFLEKASSYSDRTKTWDKPTCLYVPVPGTGDRLWVVSRQVSSVESPEAKAFLAQTAHRGRFVPLGEVYQGGSMLATGYKQARKRDLPADAVALQLEDPPQGRVELWAPIEDTKDLVWVVSPEAKPLPQGALQGFSERLRDPSLDQHLRGSFQTRVALVLATPAEYRALRRIERVSSFGLAALFVGVCCLVVALRK
ncbi:MAG: hypothetical protein AB7N76_11420 [Planctomycetota bacterium]